MVPLISENSLVPAFSQPFAPHFQKVALAESSAPPFSEVISSLGLNVAWRFSEFPCAILLIRFFPAFFSPQSARQNDSEAPSVFKREGVAAHDLFDTRPSPFFERPCVVVRARFLVPDFTGAWSPTGLIFSDDSLQRPDLSLKLEACLRDCGELQGCPARDPKLDVFFDAFLRVHVRPFCPNSHFLVCCNVPRVAISGFDRRDSAALMRCLADAGRGSAPHFPACYGEQGFFKAA